MIRIRTRSLTAKRDSYKVLSKVRLLPGPQDMDTRSAEQLSREELVLKFSTKSVANPRHPERNEDAVGFDEGAQWAAVLDGVGGSFAGYEASRKALEVIRDRLSRAKSPRNIDQMKGELEKTFKEASKIVAKETPGGQTTVVLAWIVGFGDSKIAVIGSVGDCRAYLLRDGKLEKTTQDDSIIPSEIGEKLDNVVNDNDLSDQEMGFFYQRNIITQDLGMKGVPVVHLYQKELRKGDKIILTSDGVHDNLTFDEIGGSVSEQDDVAGELVDRAYARSLESHFRAKKDDISAVVVEVH